MLLQLKALLRTNVLNDVTAASFSVSFSQLPAVKKDIEYSAAVTSLRTFIRSSAFRIHCGCQKIKSVFRILGIYNFCSTYNIVNRFSILLLMNFPSFSCLCIVFPSSPSQLQQPAFAVQSIVTTLRLAVGLCCLYVSKNPCTTTTYPHTVCPKN